jgi:hypothetical protein
VEEARTALAGLLDQIDKDASDGGLRLEAATMANRLALFHGDPSLADVAESLAVDIPAPTPGIVVRAIENEAAVAKATRRAIALANAQKLTAPRDLAISLVESPDVLLQEVRRRIDDDEIGVARAILEVALTRHPTSADLRALHVEVLAAEGEGGAGGAQALWASTESTTAET